MSRPAPLAGITVIDLTQVFAGPYCTYQLALLGAKVIKIEPPGGELTRYGGALKDLVGEGLGLAFCTQNADKDCVEIDLKQPAGIAKVLELTADADIFVQNYRPGVATRLGLGEDAVRGANANIIYCSISAYGGEGPVGHRPAYDHVVQAMSGIMQTTGTDDMGPVKVGAPYVDYATGLNAAFALMAALRERDRTDEPQTVNVAMLDTALNLMANNLVTTATTGNEIPKLGNEAASRAPSSGCFEASDGVLIMLAANNERQFVALCAVLGHPEWAEDARWQQPQQRAENQSALRAVMENAFRHRSAAEWETLCDQAGVPASRVRSVGEVLAEGQPEARDLLRELSVGTRGTPVSLPGIGFRLNGDSLQPQQAPRISGQDNAKYLT
ncbi:MAG TPA: CoA transferase [Gammaproteobacteria bacterium]|nr:CoA transferase [Gammaproteobacteria bacterium]|tara:strand:+ start:5298 stop:6452 length:1155 start_codon:yes stop_codon:yes gene_type:complete